MGFLVLSYVFNLSVEHNKENNSTEGVTLKDSSEELKEA